VYRAEFAENLARGGNLLLYIRRHGFCCKLEELCAFLVACVFEPWATNELPAYSERT
jgi:hypothetical protein